MLAILLELPILTLVIEAVLACILAAIAGFLLDKMTGMVEVTLATLVSEIIVFVVPLALQLTWLPFYQLPLSIGQFPPDAASHLANTYLVVEIGIWTVALASVVGYFFNERDSMVFLEVAAVVGVVLCTIVAAIPFYPFGLRDTTWILLLGIVAIGVGWAWGFGKYVLENDNFITPLVIWFEYAMACWLGYQVAGRIGFLLITVPSQILFILVLYLISGSILPGTRSQRKDMFQSLMTYNLGTQHPYYEISDWRNLNTIGQLKPEPRVPGDPGNDILGGPGIVFNSCDHAAIISSKKEFKILPPGLNFTQEKNILYMDVDLRPQLRNAVITAETKDGIPVNVFMAMPHRISTGGQNVRMGESYPYDEAMIRKAIIENAVVNHNWRSGSDGKIVETKETTAWYDLVQLKGPAIVKELISHYTCDELLPSVSEDGTLVVVPRVEIANAFSARMKEAMAPWGIDVLGGGLGNITPPENVQEQYIKDWEAEWEKKIEIAVGEAEAKVATELQKVQQNVQVEMLKSLVEILHQADEDGIREELLLQQLVEAMGFKALGNKSGVRYHIDPESGTALELEASDVAMWPLLELLGMRGR